MKSTLAPPTLLAMIVVTAPFILARNNFASPALTRIDKSQNCSKAVETVQNDARLDTAFGHVDLFFSTVLEVCENLELVQEASKILSDNCIQTINPNSKAWQAEGIYKIWSQIEPTNVACYRKDSSSRDSRYCLEYLTYLQNTKDDSDKEKVCSGVSGACHKDFWNALLDDPLQAPQTYYWTVYNPKEQRNRLKQFCGEEFFDDDNDEKV